MAISITISGTTYPSIAAAYRELDIEIPLITVRWRLKQDWDVYDAFFMPSLEPEFRCKGKKIRKA